VCAAPLKARYVPWTLGVLAVLSPFNKIMQMNGMERAGWGRRVGKGTNVLISLFVFVLLGRLFFLEPCPLCTISILIIHHG